MLTYTIEQCSYQNPSARKTLFVEGKVDCWKWERLQNIILDSLSCCNELVINLEMAEGCDDSFIENLCRVRERAKMMGKRLKIRGKGACCATVARKLRRNTRDSAPGISDPR